MITYEIELRHFTGYSGVKFAMNLFCSDFTHQFADPVQHQVDDLFADGVVSAGVVVGSILLASDQLLRVKQLAVHPSAHLI